jgi:hypothetical protein
MLRIYFCGGAGSNLGKQIKDLDIQSCFIDTSTSNLKTVDLSQVYLMEGIDGAGKHRATTYECFKKSAEDVLIRFKPSEQLNVVVSSLSGGSGSVISPLLAKELISKGHNVIVIGVDSKNSVIELENSVKTLKSFKSISDTIKKSISLFYVENTSRKEADQRAIRFINLLSLLVNKQYTEEFDTSDLGNYISFDRVTNNPPSVSVIEINANEQIVPEKNTNIVSTILVTKDHNSSISQVTPEYLSTCIVTDPNYNNEDIRMDNVLGKLSLIVENLEKQIKEHADNKMINKFRELEVETSNDDGMVL